MDHLGIESKDYSSFSKHADTFSRRVAGENGLSTQASIESKLEATESRLRAADAIIRKPSTISKSPKVTKQVINTLLAPAKSATELLNCVAEVVPQTEPIAELFRALLKLELDRQDNDKQIATLYHSMASMLVVLARLDNVFLGQTELTDLLNEKLDEIVKLLNDFGNFCDVYYKHRPVVRFLRLTKYSEMLEEYVQSFASIKHDLEALISHRTTLTVLQTSETITTIASDVSELTRFMNAQTTREREAQNFVDSKGGVGSILKDDKLLDEVAIKLGDNVTKSLQASRSLQYSLHADLEVQIKENQTIFIMKLQCVKDQIEESINRSTTTILMKLDSGPHEIINDPDIKAVWKDMALMSIQRWRNTVKSRHFVSAVHHYFEQEFTRYAVENGGAKHPDLWALNYLSRVIFYPALGDAIDEDSSGYVSLHELNHFFDARPPNWTTPQWLAYWAAGWYKDNLQYRDKIMVRLGALSNSIDGLHPENKEALKGYLDSVESDIKRIVESLYDGALDYFDDESDEVVELDTLRNKYSELVSNQVEQQLVQSKHQLDDKRILSIVVGSGSRLESKLLCVMHHLLKWHHKMFDIGKDKPLQEGVVFSMTNSFQVIFDAFTARTRSLMESWRQQRMDPELQAQWYANGLFEDWFKREQDQPDSYDYDDEELTEEEEEGDNYDDEELVEYATRPPTAAGTEASNVGEDPHEDSNHELIQENNDQEEIIGEHLDEPHENEDEDHAQDRDHGQISDENENEPNDTDGLHSSTARENGLDYRLQCLETEVKELKAIMLRILERLEV